MAELLNAGQAEAEKIICDWFRHSTRQTFVLTGYAGTGKTTILKRVVCDSLGLEPEKSAAFVTPTGKAATVLIKKGIPACTVHRLIYQSIIEEKEMLLNGKTIKVEKLTFKRRESIDKSIKLIVLDEASMVSDEVLFDILNFGVKVLLCGDDAQLPPVEGFNTYLKTPDYSLTEIVRQQQDNPIIHLSELARNGGHIPYGNFGDRAFVINRRNFTGERRKKLMLRAEQIICGLNKTRYAVNDEMRSYLGYYGLPKDGEKLICTVNNWEQFIDSEMKFNMVNGIIGTAIEPFYDEPNFIGFTQFKPDFLDERCPEALPFDTGVFVNGEYRYRHGDYFERFNEEGEATGAFTLNRFEYGYCISCHKAQGSEFSNAIVFDESYAFKEDANRWLYTAITRARDKLIIVR
ncbi:MAG: ATP-dependent RecD-like DNA helicase [Candidatus Coproplasma sp.]